MSPNRIKETLEQELINEIEDAQNLPHDSKTDEKVKKIAIEG